MSGVGELLQALVTEYKKTPTKLKVQLPSQQPLCMTCDQDTPTQLTLLVVLCRCWMRSWCMLW